eukprot:TRINITY_DN62125_c0_g2_i2.p1 TRINITY_DN62125_c0_g2~~TRINITY_DN62125_c0_g2_i2.p1  ORF type:complete len:266 (+),score=48.04 TRINITY_DN62125_c0_g2_i2:104-901(+)
MIRRQPRSTLSSSSAASDVYKRQGINAEYGEKSRMPCADCAHPVRWWQSVERLWCGHKMHKGCFQERRSATDIDGCPIDGCGAPLRTNSDCAACSKDIRWYQDTAPLICGHGVHDGCPLPTHCNTCGKRARRAPRPSIGDALLTYRQFTHHTDHSATRRRNRQPRPSRGRSASAPDHTHALEEARPAFEFVNSLPRNLPEAGCETQCSVCLEPPGERCITLGCGHFFCEACVLGLSLIHISEPTRLLSISYAVFCLKKKKNHTHN